MLTSTGAALTPTSLCLASLTLCSTYKAKKFQDTTSITLANNTIEKLRSYDERIQWVMSCTQLHIYSCNYTHLTGPIIRNDVGYDKQISKVAIVYSFYQGNTEEERCPPQLSPDRLASTTLAARGGGCTAATGGTYLGQPVPAREAFASERHVHFPSNLTSTTSPRERDLQTHRKKYWEGYWQ